MIAAFVAKSSQYFIFGDQSWPVESLAKALPPKSEVSVWIDGKGWVTACGEIRQTCKPRSQMRSTPIQAVEFVPQQNGDSEAVAIVGFKNPDIAQRVVNALKIKHAGLKILQVGSKETRSELNDTKRSVAWSDLLTVGVDTEIHLLSIQERVRELRDVVKGTERIAILLQDDPDPDGLAAALALRKVLNRNAQTAPIVSMGRVSRPENVAMVRLLEFEVESIRPQDLNDFEMTIMVDCQPSFFKGRNLRADVILDHHPKVVLPSQNQRKAIFEEIREDLGSVSTLMTQYLRAANVEVSQRLATALLYGIKSDTLMLNREVSELDLEAFVYLYPRINGNTLRKIERPELPLDYLESLSHALKLLKVQKGVAVLPLGNVAREEWIPQAADLALQVEGAEWALGCGIYDDKVIISCRNCGYIQHSGEIFKVLFEKLGCAGGHRTMAKAVIPRLQWELHFGAETLRPARMASLLRRILVKELAARSC